VGCKSQDDGNVELIIERTRDVQVPLSADDPDVAAKLVEAAPAERGHNERVKSRKVAAMEPRAVLELVVVIGLSAAAVLGCAFLIEWLLRRRRKL
jgi:hypothetical protein